MKRCAPGGLTGGLPPTPGHTRNLGDAVGFYRNIRGMSLIFHRVSCSIERKGEGPCLSVR
jgi:hypothetical protein